MKILFVAAEAHPFIRTGGLGDVIGALPKYIAELGNDVRVVIPKYSSIGEEQKSNFNHLKYFFVKVGWRNEYCGVDEVRQDNITYYFLDNEKYFKRDRLYGYGDDGERFAFFDRASLDLLKEIDWCPDVIHCNDWQCGMIPVLHKLEYNKDPFYRDVRTVYSIHNLLFQGNFPAEVLPELFGYDYEQFNNGTLKMDDNINFMKGGINYADKVATVSNSYAQEIQTAYYGEKLDGLLSYRKYDLKGVLNGIDYEEYNPENDEFIIENYGVNTIENKVKNKLALQKELGLEVNADTAVISIISRLTNQKGIDLVMSIVEPLLKQNVQLVVLGTGDENYENYFKWLAWEYRGKVSVNILFGTALSHRIYAGSDLFLMPSAFEPCGLGQLIALRYGTIPVVRETGGLRDTIKPYNKYDLTGNGFSFANYSSDELINTIEMALEVYKDKEKWINLVKSAMNSDNSWNKSVLEYMELYKSITGIN